MGYVTNFSPGDFDNHDKVLAETNRLFGTDLEIRQHPRPDKTYIESVDQSSLHSLWSPHDHVVCRSETFPYLNTEWFNFYCAHLHWVGDKAHLNEVYWGERRDYVSSGKTALSHDGGNVI